MSDSAAFVFHATTNYGDPTSKGMGYTIQKASCPVPGCIWTGDLTSNNTFPWHCNTHKWTCDSTGLSLQAAANLRIDEHGHLLGVDEMQKVEL